MSSISDSHSCCTIDRPRKSMLYIELFYTVLCHYVQCNSLLEYSRLFIKPLKEIPPFIIRPTAIAKLRFIEFSLFINFAARNLFCGHELVKQLLKYVYISRNRKDAVFI